ncbi:unnamed protein product [Cylindrotheca closterium]|uniref:EGF-like domain-containing protein n=1 Tax=Cylindrotheca closterium TaxID=2856 RepID=A0AAD2GBG7_9STRA|nr:unnamed protein product [Cylindrotheca closterium]
MLLLILSTYCSEALDGVCKANRDCLHDGYCDDVSNQQSHVYDSKCICTQNYTGPYCETPKIATALDCVANADCQNGGTCKFLSISSAGIQSQGICECPSDHYGYHCQEKCPCHNGGSCNTEYSTGAYECQCTKEFYGPLCVFRWEGEREEADTGKAMLISIVAISFGIFFCLVCSIASSSRGVGNENIGKKVGLERMEDGTIVYRSKEEEGENKAEGGIPGTPRTDPVLDDSEPDNLTDLELT